MQLSGFLRQLCQKWHSILLVAPFAYFNQDLYILWSLHEKNIPNMLL